MEVFTNHFQCYGAVDGHNNKQHDGNGGYQMCLETTWKTMRWELHHLTFELVHNTVDKPSSPRKRCSTSIGSKENHHELISAPHTENLSRVNGASTTGLTISSIAAAHKAALQGAEPCVNVTRRASSALLVLLNTL
eukprot:4904015-Ditylum_brightwellii.AAC.1